MPLAWLFDIDGTLIRTDGAAREALAEATAVCLGVRDSLEDVAFAGRTDPWILGEILRKHGKTLGPDETERFWELARGRMGEMLRSGRGCVLPGVPRLLEAIAAEPAWVATLLTGNTRAMATLKLGHFGLFQAFAFGTFGEEASDRDALARVAVARAREWSGVSPERCVVVGDTELDIQCARAAGARVVAVATGVRARVELEPHGPDLLLDDLVDGSRLVTWARGLAR